MRRRRPWVPAAVGLTAAIAVVVAVASGGDEAQAPGRPGTNPVVGSDLHSLVVDPSDPRTIYVGSHEGVSISTDGGKTWEVEETLSGADAMGWGFTDDAILVGGHPGLSVSTDDGATFELRNEGLPATDIHALGAGGGAIYAASPAAGLLVSTDGGDTFEVRNGEVGQAFMGRILVDSKDKDHLVAPDMGSGAVESTDGGRTWTPLGSGEGVMWVSWGGPDHVVATAQGSVAVSEDGGKTWSPLEVPGGTSIVEMSPNDPRTIYAAALQAPEAVVYVSTDGGASWARP